MILHPDGRVEGTLEELAKWKEMFTLTAEQDIRKKLGSGGTGYVPSMKDNNTYGIQKGNRSNEEVIK